MAEGSYEYECSRAELLGIAPPNYEEWQEIDKVRRENEHAAEMTQLDTEDEHITQTGGKMDEINNILSITQMRLNKFKKACGSLSNLLKIRGGAEGDELQPADNQTEPNVAASDAEPGTANDGENPGDGATSSIDHLRKTSTDLHQKMSNQVDKLDILLAKSENAQYSMENQNQQIKSFLAK